MADRTEVPVEDQAIGERVRYVRRRRGLSLQAAAGLAKIDHSFLSRLETGKRAFIRRGLLEDLAAALSCSVADLTGQPYLAPDKQSAAAASVLPALSVSIHDSTLDDAPDVSARPVDELARLARDANEAADQVSYVSSGRILAEILSELHAQATQGNVDDRRAALTALVEACMAAQGLARTLGHSELALTIARRGFDAARRLERDDLVALMAMNRGHALMRIGARYKAEDVLVTGLRDAESGPGPTLKATQLTEGRGMLHLSAALLNARDGQLSDSVTHLEEAKSLAAFTGERNHMYYHFGPANVAAWGLTIAVETDGGPEAAERFLSEGVDLSVLNSKDRTSNAYFDLARAWAQAGGARDQEAIRALDTADRTAPLRVRNDPIARDLAVDLRRRARRKVWELDSLCNRLGVA